jgi:hypothetical protein
MNHCRSIHRIALTCALIAASASTAHSDTHDSYGLQYHDNPGGNSGPVLVAPNVPRISNVLPGRESVNQLVAQRGASVRTERFSDFNLAVNLPNGPWTKLGPELGSRACLLLSRKNPEMNISLAGQLVGVEAKNTNATLLAQSQSKMKSLPGAVLFSTTEVSAGDINGILYEATVGKDEAKTHYAIWVAAHNGYNYKLAVYGNQKDKPEINTAIRSFVRDLKHIEPTKLAHTSDNQTGPRAKGAERKPEIYMASQGNEHSLLRK